MQVFIDRCDVCWAAVQCIKWWGNHRKILGVIQSLFRNSNYILTVFYGVLYFKIIFYNISYYWFWVKTTFCATLFF